ncbi:AraC family transcriptional regulator [Motilimonas cestriensis]|uniref:AraC family transcriptional regulator n=1 Tax=Motilimonas cestriensis TaxID=2742685 RepID=A0ABS8W753_9GAMM|nr:AraC family transcriptional regulator [Motilimonas cestriensis]MCE2593644.1 AraC family transcriptional regulator [Motilimonas cestriensis]
MSEKANNAELEKFNLSHRQQGRTISSLSQLSMSGVFYTHSTMRQPWGVTMPAIPLSTMFHLILDGEAIVSISDKRITLGAGDFILMPRGKGHDIVDINNTPASGLFEQNIEQVTEHYEKLTSKGKGPITTALCGTVLFENEITASIINSMPDYVLIPANSEAHQPIASIVKAIQLETESEGYGAGLIVAKLADVLILQCIRAWVSQLSGDNPNWLMAHTDKRLSPVMELIHTDPAANINIAVLAGLARMSRTTFIDYFKKVVGQTPKKYITDWRLALAKTRLIGSSDNVLNIALEVGYQSEASFSRAYKAKFGVPPSQTKRGE